MTNELSGWISTLVGGVQQMQQWPVAVLIVAVLLAVGTLLKWMDVFPNKAIPLTVVTLGAVANGFLGNPGTVAPDQRYPMAVLAFQGVILGVFAIVIYFVVIKRIPFLAGKSGDTATINKKDTVP